MSQPIPPPPRSDPPSPLLIHPWGAGGRVGVNPRPWGPLGYDRATPERKRLMSRMCEPPQAHLIHDIAFHGSPPTRSGHIVECQLRVGVKYCKKRLGLQNNGTVRKCRTQTGARLRLEQPQTKLKSDKHFWQTV